MKKNILKKIVFTHFFLISLYSFLHSFQFVPYQGATKKIVTDNFVILFPKKYEAQAKKTASYAEDIHKNLSEFMQWKPLQRTTIVLTDHTDYPNGISVTFIRNIIYLYLTPLDLEKSLRNYEDPLYSLILHEYTHILHLDQIRGGVWFWRVLYGKLYCPASGSFRWYLEGVAVLSETLNAPGGRLSSAYNSAIIKAAAREKKIPSYDELIFPVVDWPHGDAVYHYGARFVEYLYNKYGKEKFQEFLVDLSNDFWPFVLQFSIKHKKIYGKSLRELWQEWSYYEIKLAEVEVQEENTARQLTNLEGEMSSIERGDGYFLIASNSYKNDRYLYQLFDDGKLKKIHLDYIRDLSITNNSKYILYTKANEYIGGFQYFDLYSLNLKTRISKKLTEKMRINYISFAKEKAIGVLVGHNGFGSKLYEVKFSNGEIFNLKEIKLPDDIDFIDKPSISTDGSKTVFSARMKDGNFKLFLVDMDNYISTNITQVQNATDVRWVENEEISFILESNRNNGLYAFNLKTNETTRIKTTSIYIYDGIIVDDKIYYIDYTVNGEELFVDDLKTEGNYTHDIFDNSDIETQEIKNDLFPLKNTNWNTTVYIGFRYLYPRVWGFVPYQLGSYAYYSTKNGYIAIPFIGPQFILYNVMPLGRFSYFIGIGFDYLKMYPDNFCTLTWKVPFLNISYSWQNWAGGSKNYLDNQLIERRYNNYFPISFANNITFYYTIPLPNSHYISWLARVTHVFEQYNFTLERMLNQLYFTTGVGYSFIKPRNKASRWDRGISMELYIVKYTPMAENLLFTFVAADVDGRVPFGSAFYFLNIKGGLDFFQQPVFRVDADLYRFSENITGSSSSNTSNSLNIIDTKAFPSALLTASFGSAFISVDTGFDITVVKKSKYWHFATLGFKEFYIRTYGEFVFLYNELNESLSRGIMYDGVIELALDLFAAYGNITTTIIVGGAIGHRVGDILPAWSIFTYFRVEL